MEHHIFLGIRRAEKALFSRLAWKNILDRAKKSLFNNEHMLSWQQDVCTYICTNWRNWSTRPTHNHSLCGDNYFHMFVSVHTFRNIAKQTKSQWKLWLLLVSTWGWPSGSLMTPTVLFYLYLLVRWTKNLKTLNTAIENIQQRPWMMNKMFIGERYKEEKIDALAFRKQKTLIFQFRS